MAETATPKGAARRWMRVTLVISLAVNLLVAGLVVGALIRGGPDRERRVARDFGGAPFVMALDREDRRAVIAELREEPGGLRGDRRKLRERFEALLAALRSTEFDREAVQEILAEQRGVAAARQAAGERLLLDRLEAMPQAERAAYADRLERSLRRGGRP